MIRRYYEEELRYLHEAGKVFAEAHPDVAATLRSLGRLQRSTSDYDAAEQRLREALAIEQEINGVQSRTAAETMVDLASVLRGKGELDEAERLWWKTRAWFWETPCWSWAASSRIGATSRVRSLPTARRWRRTTGRWGLTTSARMPCFTAWRRSFASRP